MGAFVIVVLIVFLFPKPPIQGEVGNDKPADQVDNDAAEGRANCEYCIDNAEKRYVYVQIIGPSAAYTRYHTIVGTNYFFTICHNMLSLNVLSIRRDA